MFMKIHTSVALAAKVTPTLVVYDRVENAWFESYPNPNPKAAAWLSGMTYDDVLYELQKWPANTGLDEAAQEAHQQFLGEVFFMFRRAFLFTEEQLVEFDEELHYQMGLVPATALQNFQSGATLDYDLTPLKWDFQKYVEMGKVPVVVTFN